MIRARLIQVLVQPVLVADDGETLTALQAMPITVEAKDWPTFATDVWPMIVSDAEARLNAEVVELPQSEAS